MTRVPLARRQLRRSRQLAIGGIAAIAASMILIIALDAVTQGMEQRLTAFLQATGAEVVVAQEGVTTMHMTESALPAGVAGELRSIEGVSEVIPALYVSASVTSRGRSGLVYLIGYDPSGPTLLDLVKGERPGREEIVLDAALARDIGVQIGDEVSVLGHPVKVSGLVDGTQSIASSTALVHITDLSAALGIEDTASYLFVRAEPRTGAARLARRIEERVGGTSAVPLERFIESERKVVSDMSTGIVRAITLTGLLIGLTITLLVAHTLVARQSRDIAVLRALGQPSGATVALIVRQALIVLVLAALVSGMIVIALATALPRTSDALQLTFEPSRVLRLQGFTAAAVLIGSAWPAVRALNIDPARAFRS